MSHRGPTNSTVRAGQQDREARIVTVGQGAKRFSTVLQRSSYRALLNRFPQLIHGLSGRRLQTKGQATCTSTTRSQVV